MRYFLSILLLSVLLAGCGRDAAEVAANPAAAPALAPATAPLPPTRDQGDLAKPEPSRIDDADRIALPEPEPENPPRLDRADAKAMTALNRNPAAPARATAPPAPVVPRSPASTQERISTDGGEGTPVPLKTFSAASAEATEVFRVSTTPCYGDCPRYELTVYHTGLLVLNGKKNFVRQGMYFQQLAPADRAELMARFEAATSGGLLTVYPEGEAPLDVSATVLRYPGSDGFPQSIRVYAEAPEKLQQLLDRVLELAQADAWQPVK